MAGKIFINYRRGDDAGLGGSHTSTGRLALLAPNDIPPLPSSLASRPDFRRPCRSGRQRIGARVLARQSDLSPKPTTSQ
jgi:hypothetical protein